MLPKLHIKLERWKYNKTFELYVSNMGHIRNKSKAPIAPRVGCNGYVGVYVGGSNPKVMSLHRVVMLTWKPTPEAEMLTIDHLDHNKRNNAVENLEWVTREENLRRAERDSLPYIGDENISGVIVTDQKGKSIIISSWESEQDLQNQIRVLTIGASFNLKFFEQCLLNIKKRVILPTQLKKYCSLTMRAMI